MELPRRYFLQLAAGAAAVPVTRCISWAQDYPSRPARIIVGSAAGDLTDIVGRLIGQWLSERLNQSFIIENRPGAGSNVGTEAAVRAPADGYTLLMVAPSAAINASLYSNLKFSFIRDITPVAGIFRAPLVVVIHPSAPARTVTELVAYAKANPGKLSFASPGIGTGPHMAGELFKMIAGVDIVHVPYRGAANALTDLMTGQVQLMITAAANDQIKAGKLHALAVTGATRWEQLPDLPTVADFLPGYEASAWFGVGAPKNTPAGIIVKLNKEINAALDDPKIRARLSDLGGTVLSGSPADFGRHIAAETEKWAKVVKFAGVKAE